MCDSFQRQQAALCLQPAGIARERAVRADDTVAGDEDRQRVAVVCHADGARCLRAADGGGNRTVAARLTVGDRAQRRPHAQLERRAARIKRQVKRAPCAREVFVQLRLGRVKQRRSVPRALRAEADGRDSVRRRGERQCADGRLDCARAHASITRFSTPDFSNSSMYSSMRALSSVRSAGSPSRQPRSRRASSSARMSKNTASS